MLPILEREIVDKHEWCSSEELMDYYAIGQCTPGIIAVNTATFIGRKQAGVLGGVIATLGVIFPSFVIISIIAALLQNFSNLPAVKSAFAGIRVCVCALILNSVIKLWKSSVKDKSTLIFDVSPIWFVLISAATGILAVNLGVRGK